MNYLEMKKKALHLIVGKVKGFVRSVTGVPPIALESCADNMSIIDYKIHGNSIQDGTPSPDNPVEVQSVGELVTDETDINYGKYKIPVTARSKNLFNEDLILDESNWTFNDVGDQGYFYLNPIGLEEGKQYTILSNFVGSTLNNLSLIIYKGTTYVATLTGLTNEVVNFTYQNDIHFTIYVPSVNGSKNNYYRVREHYQIMIIEGKYTATTIGDYEPYHEPITTNIYLDEPLRKVGDYADYIDFKNSVVVRNISKYPLVMPYPGAIYTKGTNTVMLSFFHGRQGGFVKNSKILCPIFKNIQNAWYMDLETIHNHYAILLNYYCGLAWSRLNLIYDGTKAYRSDDETQTELTNEQITDIATEYLRTISEEYRVVYAIPTIPAQTSISLPILPTFKGITTVYEVGTTIQPSNMEAEYYSTLKGE